MASPAMWIGGVTGTGVYTDPDLFNAFQAMGTQFRQQTGKQFPINFAEYASDPAAVQALLPMLQEKASNPALSDMALNALGADRTATQRSLYGLPAEGLPLSSEIQGVQQQRDDLRAIDPSAQYAGNPNPSVSTEWSNPEYLANQQIINTGLLPGMQPGLPGPGSIDGGGVQGQERTVPYTNQLAYYQGQPIGGAAPTAPGMIPGPMDAYGGAPIPGVTAPASRPTGIQARTGTPAPLPTSTGTGSGAQGGASFLPNPFPTSAPGGVTAPGIPDNLFGTPRVSIDTALPDGNGMARLGNTPGSVDDFLAYGAGDVGYLRNMAENAGYATNVSPAWDAMIAAQQRNIERNAANLGEQFNVSGNRFSTAFGDAMTDFYGQTALDQNALLGQMTLGAQEAARGRELGAGQTLAGLGYGGAQQLSSQGFQAGMQQGDQSYRLLSQMLGGSQEAAMQQAQLGAQGALGMNDNAMRAMLSMYGVENQGAFAEAQRQMQLQQMGLSGAGDLSNLWNQSLQTGAGLGGLQYGFQQDSIDRMYNEWLRTQPAYNPLLPYQYGGATANQTTYYPQYQPSALPGIFGGLGGIFGALGPWLGGGGGSQANNTGGWWPS